MTVAAEPSRGPGATRASAPLRVAHYLWCASIGGIERVVLDLAEAQQRGGLDVSVVLGAPRGPLLDRYRRGAFRFRSAGLTSGLDLSPRKLGVLTRLFRDADVVHLHAFHPLVGLAAARAGRRIVFTEHGAFGLGRRRTLADAVKRRLKGRFVRRRADFVTFNSAHTERLARRLFGLERKTSEVVYNGTRIGRDGAGDADPEIARACRGRFVIGTSSRFTAPKRIDRLLEGFAALADRDGARLLLVGDGHERSRLASLAERLGIADLVLFAGWRLDVAAYQRLMDVCVFPSEVEAFGLVAIEALALGKPAIVFRDGGGMAEVVRGFEPRDVVESVPHLTARLATYRENPGDAASRRAYAQEFDIRRMAARMRAIYERLA